jgi:ribosomal protein S25
MDDSSNIKMNSPHIGMVNESSLHAALKEWYSQPGDFIEKKFLGFYIDIVRDNRMIEIQTANFSAISKKICTLLDEYPVHLVYPLPVQKWIKKIATTGEIKLRKSPKKGRLEDIFWELVKISEIINHPNFTFEVITIQMEETWIHQQTKNKRSSWRRKGWAIQDRDLIKTFECVSFNHPGDYAIFLKNIPDEMIFSSTDLADLLTVQISLARKMIYVFRQIGIIQAVGKKRNTLLYRKTTSKVIEQQML